MKRTFNLRLLYASVALALALAPGCGQGKDDRSDVAPSVILTNVDVQKTSTSSLLRGTTDQLEVTSLNIEDLNAPEGVVDSFFKAFFSGDEDGAFQLLTTKAQNAKRGVFLAQESDCVSWRIVGKTKPDEGYVKVLVELEDYDDVGEFQTDRLTFLLTNDNSKWRIARFEIGELEVDFEEQAPDNSPVVRTAEASVNEIR